MSIPSPCSWSRTARMASGRSCTEGAYTRAPARGEGGGDAQRRWGSSNSQARVMRPLACCVCGAGCISG
eukprot:1161625-Pelagomonas_calceolata.AAC.16